MKDKKVLIGIMGLLFVIIIGLGITVIFLLNKNKEEINQMDTKKEVIVNKDEFMESESEKSIEEKDTDEIDDKKSTYIHKLETLDKTVTENGNNYAFNESYLGWYENQYGAFHLKQIDGDNILMDFYVLGYKFVQDYPVAVMSEDTFDITYNDDKMMGIQDTSTNITITEQGDEVRFFVENNDSINRFLMMSLGESMVLFQELISDYESQYLNLSWYFVGKFTKAEPPETYKAFSSFSGNNVYDLQTGEFLQENTQPIKNREVQELYPKLAKHLPQESWYYTGDINNKNEVSIIHINTALKSYSGFTNFGLEFVEPKDRSRDTGEYILDDVDYYDSSDRCFIFTAYNIEDNVFHCLAKEGGASPIIPQGEVESGETVYSTKDSVTDNGVEITVSSTSEVSNVTLFTVYYTCTVNDDGTLLLESDDWHRVIKIYNIFYEERDESSLYQSQPMSAVYKPISVDELREKGYIL